LSCSYAENFGVAVAEAMAAGLPVIVTPDVQISPEVATEQAGLVVEGNVDALSAAIARLVASPEERRQLGENGQRLVKHCYSWKVIAQNLAEVYMEILKDPSQPPLSKGRGPNHTKKRI
jgi:glycosyltransferase involved in cell wall biosynthesis